MGGGFSGGCCLHGTALSGEVLWLMPKAWSGIYGEEGCLWIMSVHGSRCGREEELLLEASRSPGADEELRAAGGISDQTFPAFRCSLLDWVCCC